MIEKIWNSNNFLNSLIQPISIFYYLVIKIYRIFKKEKNCNVPILCVGNITIGGAGKTPTVIKIRQILSNHFKNIFVLTRGYKGVKKGPLIVKRTSTIFEVGDESLLHFEYGPTCVSKNKYLGAKLCESNGCNLIIMDDGLQSIDVKKNCKILVIDGNYGFGNQKIFPAGPLRESIKECVERSDIVLVIGNIKFIKKFKIIPKEKVFQAKKEIIFDNFKNKNLFVFSALGNNKNFHISLMDRGFNIIQYKNFSDHYIFKKNEILKIIKVAKKQNLSIVCTAKDYLKIPIELKKFIHPIGLDLKIKNRKLFEKKLLEMI